MNYSKMLSSFFITAAIIGAVFLLWFGAAFIRFPDLASKLLSCGIAVASVLLFTLGILTVTLSAAINKENCKNKEKI